MIETKKKRNYECHLVVRHALPHLIWHISLSSPQLATLYILVVLSTCLCHLTLESIPFWSHIISSLWVTAIIQSLSFKAQLYHLILKITSFIGSHCYYCRWSFYDFLLSLLGSSTFIWQLFFPNNSCQIKHSTPI